MSAFRARPRPGALAGVGAAIVAAGLAACRPDDVVKEEPTPIPPTALTPAPPQPSTTIPGAAAPAEIAGSESGEAREPEQDSPG